MAKITNNDRYAYQEKAKSFSAVIKALMDEETSILSEIKTKPPDVELKKLVLVDKMLNLSSNYVAINGVSMAVLKVKNEEALNDARKVIYKAVIYLEEVVSNYIDAAFSEYDDKLAAIEQYDQTQRYNLIRKMGFTIDLLQLSYGDNSKWRWTFVELEGRYAAIAKNILDLRNAVTNSRMDSPHYEPTVYHIRLVKELLARAASRYRDKYELSTQQVLDFKTGILFLSALMRTHIVLNERDDAAEVKKKLNIWSAKLEADIKKQEENKKKI
ncbi:MAG: hypothetical protein LBC80_05520 [Treponema sp.]|jgi:hypothetical protein|nr:hypothetical protein [Treponema sp.]